jgi:DNA mismatch repair protein MutS2
LTPEILSLLEFDRLKEIVSSFSFSVLGREGIMSLVPIMEKKRRVEMIGHINEFRGLFNSTHAFPAPNDRDIRQILTRIQEGTYHLSVPELIAAAEITGEFKAVGAFLGKYARNLQGLGVNLLRLPDLHGTLKLMIDEQGKIRDNATKELKAIRQGYRRAHKSLIHSAERLVADKKKYLQEELFTTREERIVLPVLLSEKKHVSGIVHGMSQTQSTVFIEPMELVELNNEYATYRMREEEEIKRILRSLTEIIIDNMECYLRAVEEMKLIDTLYGIASFAETYGLSVPVFADGPLITIRGGKHPLLVAKKGSDQVVPFDVLLGKTENLLLVSGPNMGGKTVLLKSIGIITVMAYAGMHIPAKPDSIIPEIDSIYADIGDEQSIEMDLSTFSSHIKHVTAALRSANEHSLVLLDEIGVGTDPEEGMGIAMAALGSLAEKGALTFATTHYGKLKHFVAANSRMCNASMEFDLSSGMPTYRLAIGIPGSSHGFAIARKEGFPPALLEKAKSYLDENALKTEELIVALEQLRKEEEAIKAEATEHREKFAELRSKYEEKYRELKKREAEFIKDARMRAEETVRETRREMERIVREIRETQASKDSIKDAKSTLDAKIRGFDEQEKPVAESTLAIGDFVFSTKLKLSGTVIELLEGYAKVESENIRFLAPLDTLEVKEKRKEPRDASFSEARDAEIELDIRGLMVDEARHVVLRFIDDAVFSSLKTVCIIHGKGTGALREMVAEMLRDDKRIDGFRLGYWNEGGSGVTVVSVKA